jgi:hypothetical protein
MATVIVTACKATGGGRPDTPMIVVAGSRRASHVITTSASNSVASVIGNQGETVVISVSGNGVRIAVAVGANPDAAALPEYLLASGGIFPFYCASGDTRFAVADV